MRKVFHALILALAAFLPQNVWGQFDYAAYDNGSIAITKYHGNGGAVAIPASIDGHAVISIGFGAFESIQNVTSVTIPNSVMSIGQFAFEQCLLRSITIANSVTNIGYGAFSACTNLTSVSIPSSVTAIGSFAFEDCWGLTNVTLPSSVTNIGVSVFARCSSLTNITTAPNNRAYSSADGVLFDKAQTTLVEFPAGKAGVYTIPDGVTSIAESAFESCPGLTTVNFAESVSSIGYGAFRNSSGLTSVTLPNGIIGIGDSAFSSCVALTNLTIPENLRTIGAYAFSKCSGLTSVTIPRWVAVIGGSAFFDCAGLTNIAVASSNPAFKSADGVLFNKGQTTLIQCPGAKVGGIRFPIVSPQLEIMRLPLVRI